MTGLVRGFRVAVYSGLNTIPGVFPTRRALKHEITEEVALVPSHRIRRKRG
jgi:hypothetical protein